MVNQYVLLWLFKYMKKMKKHLEGHEDKPETILRLD
ncbi:MAG: hypothetical protein K0S41_1943 [Anaerocolumna sp.]|jgi:hypothetical protein|nr:hypothetical protein [Anaerocolumna sp.]